MYKFFYFNRTIVRGESHVHGFSISTLPICYKEKEFPDEVGLVYMEE